MENRKQAFSFVDPSINPIIISYPNTFHNSTANPIYILKKRLFLREKNG